VPPPACASCAPICQAGLTRTQLELDQRRRIACSTPDHGTEAAAEQSGEPPHADGPTLRDAEQHARLVIGGDDFAVGIDREQTFLQAANPLGTGMEGQQRMARVFALEQAALDQAHAHAGEAEGVWLMAAMVARDIERAEQFATPVEDRRRAAGEHAVAVQIVLGPEDLDRRALDQRGADRVGAALAFAPVGARLQRDPVGAIDEGGVADAVQDQSARIGEQHHAARRADLLVEVLHDAGGVREQHRAALARHHEVAAGGARRTHALAHLHAEAMAAYPRAQYWRRQPCFRHCP
jgi:hypothetical protein